MATCIPWVDGLSIEPPEIGSSQLLFRKLPGTLGREIKPSCRELKRVQQNEMVENQEPWSVGHRINI